jgi:hypothetical protein
MLDFGSSSFYLQYSNQQDAPVGCQEAKEPKVRFPDDEKMSLYARYIQAWESMVDDIIGFLDGFSLASEYSSEKIEQNTM